MAKTLTYLLLLVVLATAAGLGVVVLSSGGSAPLEADAKSDVATAREQTIKALRASDRNAQIFGLKALAQRLPIQALTNPELAVRSSRPILTPSHPPVRETKQTAPRRQDLLDSARQLLDEEAKALGSAVIAVVDFADRSVEASSKTESDLARALLGALVLEGAPDAAISGLVILDEDIYDVAIAPISAKGDNLALLAASTLSAERLNGYGDALGQQGQISLIRDGKLVTSTISSSDLKGHTSERAKALRSPEALTKPPAEFSKPSAMGEQTVHLGVVREPTLDEARGTTGLLVTISVPTVSASGWQAAKGSGPLANPGDHLALWLGSLFMMLVLGLIGVAVVRAEASTAVRSTTRALRSAPTLDEAQLSVDGWRLVDAVRDLVGAGSSPDADRIRAENQRLAMEAESLESKLSQLGNQLDYARKQVSKVQGVADSKAKDYAKLAEQSAKVDRQIATLERELQAANAREQQLAEELDETRRKFAARSAAVPQVPLQHAKTEEMRAVRGPMPTDRMFALKPEEMARDVGREATQRGTPTAAASTAVASPGQVAELAAQSADPEKKDHDTAEVSGEEMNALLDQIDRGPEDEPDALADLVDLAEDIAELEDPNRTRTARPSTGQVWRSRSADEPEAQQLRYEEVDGAQGSARSRGLSVPSHGAQQDVVDMPAGPSEAPTRMASAPPPWKKGEPKKGEALSPASLLEALKRRKAGAGDAARGGGKAVEKSRSVGYSGVYTRTGSRIDIDPTSDTEYFKSLYDEFLETKRTCGENTDKLTMERFVNRLARNKQALIDRYNCRSVKFQVYVKDGHAALKATPVK